MAITSQTVAFGEKSYKSEQIYQIIMFYLGIFVRFDFVELKVLPDRALLDIIRWTVIQKARKNRLKIFTEFVVFFVPFHIFAKD